MFRDSQQEAEDFLRPYFDRLSNCIRMGFIEFIQNHSAYAYKYEVRTKANIIRDNIVALSKSEFFSDSEVSFLQQRHYTLMVIDNRYILRFKKLHSDLTSSNYATPQALNFSLQLEIPGLPPNPLRLDIGYVPDPLMTEIIGIYIVCPNGKVPRWSIRLDEAETEGQTTEILFAEYVTTPKVRVKDGVKKRKEIANG
jgi:hypothetical protein